MQAQSGPQNGHLSAAAPPFNPSAPPPAPQQQQQQQHQPAPVQVVYLIPQSQLATGSAYPMQQQQQQHQPMGLQQLDPPQSQAHTRYFPPQQQPPPIMLAPGHLATQPPTLQQQPQQHPLIQAHLPFPFAQATTGGQPQVVAFQTGPFPHPLPVEEQIRQQQRLLTTPAPFGQNQAMNTPHFGASNISFVPSNSLSGDGSAKSYPDASARSHPDASVTILSDSSSALTTLLPSSTPPFQDSGDTTTSHSSPPTLGNSHPQPTTATTQQASNDNNTNRADYSASMQAAPSAQQHHSQPVSGAPYVPAPRHANDVPPEDYDPNTALKYVVNNVDNAATYDEFAAIFQDFAIKRLSVIRGNTRSYAYVDFATPLDAQRAVRAIDGRLFFGRQLKIHVSTRESRRN